MNGETNQSEFILTDDIKTILDQSIIHHENNLDKAKPANEFLTNIGKKV